MIYIVHRKMYLAYHTNRGALIDHEVGLGKMLTVIVATYEM
jgi:hypothetical protein